MSATQRNASLAAVSHSSQDIQSALLNILEDFGSERQRQTEMQRATLNVLEDFDGERLKTAMAYRGLEHEVRVRKSTEDELRQMTRELERSNEDLEQFAYIASHDLQEPLRAIASFMQLLQQRYGPQLDATALRYIDYAVQGATQMKALIQDLLEYSRLHRVSPALMEPTDLQFCLQAALTNLAAVIREQNADVTYDPLPTVLGYRVQLTHVLQNLVGNALKFRGDAPPKIHIGCRRQLEHWQISVADNGIGIAAQHLEKIFVIFQRLHGQEKYAGTGMGLSICKKIVERHGGQISVESTPGVGSTFSFTLAA